jgi:cytochrome P450
VSNTIYLLCCHPEIQGKLRNEILKELKDKEHVTFSDIEKITYLHQVVNESLRIIPPVPEVDKETDEDMFIGDFFVPKGTMVGINIYGLHHNPKIWENPNTFDPDRWEEERIRKIPNFRYSFIPFSVGSRDCVGKIFAKSEAPLILSLMLKNFEIQFDDGFRKEDVVLDFESIVKPKELKIKLKKII